MTYSDSRPSAVKLTAKLEYIHAELRTSRLGWRDAQQTQQTSTRIKIDDLVYFFMSHSIVQYLSMRFHHFVSIFSRIMSIRIGQLVKKTKNVNNAVWKLVLIYVATIGGTVYSSIKPNFEISWGKRIPSPSQSSQFNCRNAKIWVSLTLCLYMHACKLNLRRSMRILLEPALIERSNTVWLALQNSIYDNLKQWFF